MKTQSIMKTRTAIIVSALIGFAAVTNQLNSQNVKNEKVNDEHAVFLSMAESGEAIFSEADNMSIPFMEEKVIEEKMDIEPWMVESAYWKETDYKVITDEVVEETLEIEPWMLKENFGKDETIEDVLKEVEEKPLEIEDWMLNF